VLLLLSVVAFALLRLAPGDPLALLHGADLTPEERAAARAYWGLDDPLPVQYVRWAGNALRGDLGRSFADGRPVLGVIGERVPATVQLAGSALLLALGIGLGAGVLAAARPHSAADLLATAAATVLYSTPSFWLALILVLVFAVWLGWLPASGMENVRGPAGLGDRLAHLALPALVLSLREAAALARYTRASLRDVLAQDYVRTARAKGLPEHAVVLRHALPPALLPVITLLGLYLPRLVGGAIVVETVFAWPGLGRLLLEASLQRNYTVIMGEVLLVGTAVILANLLADLCYAAADPRVREAVRRVR
jgi:peptide/nickel transport system permease protein